MDRDSDHGQQSEGHDKPGARDGKLVLAFVAGVVATFVVVAVVGLFVVYTGAYNVAASEDHTSLVRWALDTNFRKAVNNATDGLAAPAATPAMAAAGRRPYKETCQNCHGGPGVERARWASGMRPIPPHLHEEAAEWEREEIYWIARHGVRMTGMPSFATTFDDETLWSIATFVKNLPAMTPEEYAASGAGAAAGS
jgi:mono/diheme cytochrome c family protein